MDALYEDHNKRLWAGTRKGIVEIKGRQCIPYPVNDHQNISFIFGIQENQQHQLLALTDKGVYRFEQNQWKKITLAPGLQDHHCRNILETGNTCYLNYGDYLVERDSSGRYKTIGKYPLDEPFFNRLARYKDRFYLSLPNKFLSWQTTDTLSLFQQALHKKQVGVYFFDSNNRCWLCTEEDGLLVSPKGSTQHIVAHIPVAYNLVSSIYEDRAGNIWVACLDGLLQIREVNHIVFTAARHPLLNDIRNLAPLTDTAPMLCTGNGLLQYKNGTFTRMPLAYETAAARADITAGIIDSWCRDAAGRTWLVMRQKKIYLLDHGLIRDLSHLAPAHPGIYWKIAYNTINNQVYVCTDTLLYGNEHGLRPFVNAANGQYIMQPRAIHIFPDGRMLVNAAGNHFLLISPGHQVLDVSAAIGIRGSNNGLVFYTEPSGKFWIGYNGGLLRFKWNNRQLPEQDLTVTTKQGLPNDAVLALTMDASNRLWAITSAGLVVIETNAAPTGRMVIHRFSEETGIISNQWLQSKLFTDPQGNIWCNFSNSVYRFNPRQIQFDNTPVRVAIEDVQLKLHPVQWKAFTDSLYNYRQLPERVTLPYDFNTISITYRAPCFSGVSGLEYAYRLNGADSNWSMPTKNTAVSFVQLPPGQYRFEVRARKSNTGWSEPARFSFIIKKPYWETGWFRGAVIALVALGLFLLFRYRIRQIRRKANMARQLRELELKALRSQMNPHFIYNALNSIQALVLNDQTDKATLYISKFGRLLRQVLNHADLDRVSLAEELEALELYIQLEQLRLHVDLQYRIEVDAGLDVHQEGIPPLVLQPFVENALWHGLSRKPGEKKLGVFVHAEGEWLAVEIIDNGIGRTPAADQSRIRRGNVSKGIDITSRRIAAYNRLPGVSAIDIIDLYHNDQPAGTKVLLRLKRRKPQPSPAR